MAAGPIDGHRAARISRSTNIVVALLAVITAGARGETTVPPFTVRVECGLGGDTVRPLTRDRGIAEAVWLGMSTRLAGSARGALEIAASVGGGFPFAADAADGSDPGRRSLTTFLLGVESSRGASGRGPFAFAGVGVGHYTLSGARESWERREPPRNQTAPACGAGIGLRATGQVGSQIAVRFHAVVADGQVRASGTFVTVGVCY